MKLKDVFGGDKKPKVTAESETKTETKPLVKAEEETRTKPKVRSKAAGKRAKRKKRF